MEILNGAIADDIIPEIIQNAEEYFKSGAFNSQNHITNYLDIMIGIRIAYVDSILPADDNIGTYP
ncbi:MAG: hypothetical protein V1735_07855 [Nanoarchaeota archaeon]